MISNWLVKHSKFINFFSNRPEASSLTPTIFLGAPNTSFGPFATISTLKHMNIVEDNYRIPDELSVLGVFRGISRGNFPRLNARGFAHRSRYSRCRTTENEKPFPNRTTILRVVGKHNTSLCRRPSDCVTPHYRNEKIRLSIFIRIESEIDIITLLDQRYCVIAPRGRSFAFRWRAKLSWEEFIAVYYISRRLRTERSRFGFSECSDDRRFRDKSRRFFRTVTCLISQIRTSLPRDN